MTTHIPSAEPRSLLPRLRSASQLWLGAAAWALAAGLVPAQAQAQAHTQAQAQAPVQAPVGLSQRTLGGLPVTLVYPSSQAAQPHRVGPITIEVALDAPLPAAPRRLVVLSHGSGGSAVTDHALAATLARAGFVVAQPQHAGDNHADLAKAGPESWQLRPAEVSRVIDALAQDAQWGPRLQLDKVGVHGMSAGGVTALALAGARWRVLNLVQHCLAHGDADPGFCLYGVADPTQQAARRQTYERARGVPEAYLPAEIKAEHGGRAPATVDAVAFDPRPDPRIAAVTLAVPLAAIFSTESLARIRIPVGVVSAGRDQLLLPAFHSGHVLASCSRCESLDHLAGAGHFDLLAPWPPELARSVGERQARGGMTEPGFDGGLRDSAFARVAAFYRQQLR